MPDMHNPSIIRDCLYRFIALSDMYDNKVLTEVEDALQVDFARSTDEQEQLFLRSAIKYLQYMQSTNSEEKG